MRYRGLLSWSDLAVPGPFDPANVEQTVEPVVAASVVGRLTHTGRRFHA